MTDKFVCPEPSDEAVKDAMSCGSSVWIDGLRAAYAVDVPRLCREEEAEALDAMRGMLWELFERPDIDTACRHWANMRLVSRFGDPSLCGKWIREANTTCVGPRNHEGGCDQFPDSFPEAAPEPTCPTNGVHATSETGPHCPVCVPTPTAPAQFVCVKGCGYAGLEANRCKNCPDVAAPPSEAPANDCKKGCTEHASCVAAARPEALPLIPNPWVIPGPCTACPCERCQAERAFVRALAAELRDVVERNALNGWSVRTLDAARKVAQ